MKKNKIEMKDETVQEVKETSRRKFIKKSSLGGMVISTLPAQSVWGMCTTSGALSVGSVPHPECENPPYLRGRSPGYYWEGGNYHGGFNLYSNNDEDCIRTQIIYLQKNTYILPGKIDVTLYEALSTNKGPHNFYWHMAATYLNSYFGFFYFSGADSYLNDPVILMEHLYNIALVIGEESVASHLSNQYDDSTTNYNGFNCP